MLYAIAMPPFAAPIAITTVADILLMLLPAHVPVTVLPVAVTIWLMPLIIALCCEPRYAPCKCVRSEARTRYGSVMKVRQADGACARYVFTRALMPMLRRYVYTLPLLLATLDIFFRLILTLPPLLRCARRSMTLRKVWWRCV